MTNRISGMISHAAPRDVEPSPRAKSIDQIIGENAGIDAFKKGLGEAACPHLVGDFRRQFWFNGYFSARTAAKWPCRIKLADMLASLLLCCAIGCGPLTNPPGPIVEPEPTPVKRDADAAKCLDQYGRSLADIFRKAADDFERGELKATDVAASMGDSQKAARVDAFLPLMERLDECDGDAAKTAVALREFAKQLEARR